MDLAKSLQLAVLILILVTLDVSPSHTRLVGQRRKREYGDNLYLPATYVIPGGEGTLNEWGEWSAPSECSRSCGGGVSYQTRQCLNVDSSGTPQCLGGNKKYFSCNTQDCPENEPDFRHQQCSYFDETPFERVQYEWVPYLKAPNPCELNCMPRGERFYYRHKAKVIDGTRCHDETNDVCVDGQCQPVGCDLMLGSEAREDKCRNCAGNGTSCKTVEGTLTMDDLQVGYNDILLIPAGATNIVIKEKAPSNNYLAIRNTSNHYYLNGNWRIDFPRPLTFAGSIWHYDRRPQGFAAPDHITALGPTSENIYLVLLYQDRNVGVHYEYSIPESSAHLTEPDSYTWTFAPYGECSAKCGGGIQTRKITCNSRTSLKQVDDELCDGSDRPSEIQNCARESCPPEWFEDEWSRCSGPCGGNGNQTREVKCIERSSTGVNKTLDDSECLKRAGNKPATLKSCTQGKVCPKWHTGAWKGCSKLCGEGVQTRQVKCYQLNNGKIEVLKNSDCSEPMPEASQKCILRPCEGVDWITSEWSGCKTCGLTHETRNAFCASKSGKIYNETFCSNRHKPELNRQCNETVACEFQWFSSQWSKCSVECGTGVQTRNIICGKLSENGIVRADDDSKCDASEKPESSKDCDTKKVCEGQWYTGPWSDCSKKCGGGKRSRKTLCIADGQSVLPKKCGEDTITFSNEDCNKEPCLEDEVIPVNASSKPITGDDEESDEYCDDDLELIDVSTDQSTTESSDSSTVEYTSESNTYESSLYTEELMFSDSTYSSDGSSDLLSTYEGSGAEGSGSTIASGVTESEAVSSSVSSVTDKETSSSTEFSTDDASKISSSSGITEVDLSTLSLSTEQPSSTDSSPAQDLTTTNDKVGSSSTEDSSTEGSTKEDSTTEYSTTEDSTTNDSTTNDSTTNDSTTNETTEYTSPESSSVANPSTEASLVSSSTSTESSESTTSNISTSSEYPDSTTTISNQSSGSTESGISTSSTSETSESSTESLITESSGSTDISGSTELSSTFESSSIQTDSTELFSTQSTDIEGRSDIWSSSSQTDSDSTDDQSNQSAATTLAAIITTEQQLRKCKLKPVKKSACINSQFGCCSDNRTAALGPFDEGCAVPETCKDTKWGCCEDGVTPSQGKNGKGCPEPLCKSSLFGCCKSDGKTDAEGENEEGCPIITTTTAATTTTITTTTTVKPITTKQSEAEATTKAPTLDSRLGPDCNGTDCAPCESEPFKCCSDKKTPAHGPNGEGCCLNSPYGCCPDNINPARGPESEGCSCEYSPYGCCPDNKTSARGYENTGCGCEFEKYGCCPDKVTPAKGPGFDGCACHTYQFGCCSDGITIQKGPHGYGCHCSQTEFKCCSDGVTAASGPNFEGCTCASSKYGCCTDGETDAQGSHFEGCENIPKIPQKACSITKDGGNCSSYTVKYFFDMEYGGCSRFWYSGCEGNENRFETIEECRGICESPAGKDACNLPKIHGPCAGDYRKYYYDSDRNTCAPFIYGGCLGNANKFDSAEECQQLCVVDESLPVCEQPREEGPCNGNFERWYFDKESDTCQRFRYGGCKGNKNNFASQEACQYQCKNPTHQKATCALPKVAGDCSEQKARWHFSQSDNKCLPFYYTGCDGNKNSYVSVEECEESCPRNITKDTCYKAAETGNCQNYEVRWYFDTKEERCRQFYYGGCGGNDNNFASEDACLNRCERKAQIPATPVPDNQLEPFRQEFCMLQSDTGPCRALEPRYYYNSQDGVCDVFGYGGCGGNQNNFKSLEDCEGNCGNVQDLCRLPSVYGRCQENITRYYYDHQSRRCLTFEYSGCRGNKNNFYSEEECYGQCQPYEQPTPNLDNRIKASREDLCQNHINECNELRCPYGISRTYDENDCERCECENPCRDYLCPEDSKCAVDIRSDQQSGSSFAPVCRKINKPGECPTLSNSTRCDIECYSDADCRGDNKCCSSGCSQVCVEPFNKNEQEREHIPTHAPQQYEPQQFPMPATLEEKSEEEVNVIQPEGDVATLRCYATGYPLPTITWKKESIVINTDQGRFVLTTTGDLQIVQVHKSDSGTYVCVATNGLGGEVQREIKLDIADPVEKKAYILGETNSSQIVEFNQPAVVRCLAGGYPKPHVNWWRGDDILALKSNRVTLDRDFSIQFNQIELSDLGTYICQAYSGQGRPVSKYVTLKAYGPVYPNTPEQEQYMKYVIDAPTLHPTSFPYLPTPHRDLLPIEPVSVNVILPNGNTFVAGNDLSIQCDVRGHPQPTATWSKDNNEIYQSDRIRISDAYTLTIYGLTTEDSGSYRCSAQNAYSSAYHVEQINVESAYVPNNCIDNEYFANCKLIVKAKYCGHQYYAKFCCKSCTLAGQFSSPFDTNLLN